MDRSAGMRKVAGAAVAALVGGLLSAAAAAAPTQAGSELPPVELSSSTFHDGDVITMSGTGCIDPATDSGDGLTAVLYRPIDLGRGGTGASNPTIEAEVAADGSYSASATIDQPMAPDGPQTAVVGCGRLDADGNMPDMLRARNVPVVIVAPALADLTVVAGAAFDLELPCTIGGAAYGSFAIHLTAAGREPVDLSVPGTFPQESSPQQGKVVRIPVPAAAAPSTYDATASCSVAESGTGAYFAGFTVTITPAGSGGTAPGADPVSGTADYTG